MKYFKRSYREELYVKRIIKQKKEIMALKNRIIAMNINTLYERGIISSHSFPTMETNYFKK